MMKKQKLLFLMSILAMSFFISACTLSPEEKQTLKDTVPLAEAYYEEKYGCDIEITDYSYNYYTSNGRHYLTSEMFFTTSDGSIIRYAFYKKHFSDTKQADEIIHTLKSTLIPQLESHIQNPYYFDFDTDYFSCNEFTMGNLEDKSYFHTYFDRNNWIEFFTEEKPSVYFSYPLYIISKDTTKHDKITDYVNTLFSQYMDISRLEIVYLSQALYNTDSFYNIEGEDGFYASYSIVGNNISVTTPQYIKVVDGIYITATEADFSFLETDFVISEKMALGEAISKYNIAYEDAENKSGATDTYGRTTPQSFHSKIGYAYKVTFSDSFIKRTYNEQTSWTDCCIKVVPSELDEDITQFYQFILHESDYPIFQNGDLDENNTTFYFYLDEPKTSEIYICFGKDDTSN